MLNTQDISSQHSRSNSDASSIIAENESSDQILLEQETDCSIHIPLLSGPDNDDDDDSAYFYGDNNDGLYADNHLNRGQLYSLDYSERKHYQRAKHSSTKTNVERRKKIKYANSMKIKSRDKQLKHERLAKQVELTLPNTDYILSPQSTSSYSSGVLRSVVVDRQRLTNKYQQYLINETNIANEPSFDDVMITFLLDMQNRDLSPNDYEILLRLDERVQRKTVNTNILESLPTINVNDTHLTEQCTICLETYILEQQLKLLPCLHLFHLNCIETYLSEFSIQCPLDNIPLI